jgi:hypothetical protein
MKINKMTDLKKMIQRVIKDWTEEDERPEDSIMIYNEGMEAPSFMITIEKQELDYFIDKRGRRWIMAIEQNGVEVLHETD